MLDHSDWKIINYGLEHGPFTETSLRSLGFNYTTTKPRLDKLVERKFLEKMKIGRQKYVYDIGDPQWDRIVEEEARSSGKLVPSLPLAQVKALIGSNDWSRIKLATVEFDLVGYRKDESGSFGLVREKVLFKPGPIEGPDRSALLSRWLELQKQVKELTTEDKRSETLARVSVPLPPPIDPPSVDLSLTESVHFSNKEEAKAESKIQENELLVPWSSADSFETVRNEVTENTTTMVPAESLGSVKSKPTFTTLSNVKLVRRDGRLYSPEYRCYVSEVPAETLRKMKEDAGS